MAGSQKIFRIFTANFTIGAAILLGISDPAFAQCDQPSAAAVEKPVIERAIKKAANQVMNSMTSDFSSFIGPSNSTAAPPAGIPGASVSCTTFATCMQQAFAQLAGTNVNNQLMQSIVNAKGYDYMAAQGYTHTLQQHKADLAMATASGNLGYQNHAVCVPATLATGASALSTGVANNTAGFGAPGRFSGAVQQTGTGNSGTTPHAPNNVDEYTPTLSQVSRVSNNFSQIQNNFYDSASDGTAAKYPHWDTDVYSMDQKLVFQPVGNGDIEAYDQYMNYILGLPPENPSKDPNFRKTDTGKTAVLASHEKIGFYNTAELAFVLNRNERMLTASGAAASVASLFTAASAVPPVGKDQNGNNNSTSHAAWMNAMFQQVAEDPNTIAVSIKQIGDNGKINQFIASLILYANYIDYEQSLIEDRNYRVRSALLALKTRQTNFATNP